MLSNFPGRKKRDKLHIFADICNITKDGCLKTQIMYRANLSFTQLNEYLDLLSQMKMISITQEKKKAVYRTTPKGLQYLQNYREIVELLIEGSGVLYTEEMSLSSTKHR